MHVYQISEWNLVEIYININSNITFRFLNISHYMFSEIVNNFEKTLQIKSTKKNVLSLYAVSGISMI